MAGEHLPVTGGCLCGAVRYASGLAPISGSYCHCTMCRKTHGGLFGTFLRFGPDFAITLGAPGYFQSSTFARRGFCTDCGSHLTFQYQDNPDVWVAFGSLDRPEDWPLTKAARWGPSHHSHFENRVSWYATRDDLPKETGPSAVAQAAKAVSPPATAR